MNELNDTEAIAVIPEAARGAFSIITSMRDLRDWCAVGVKSGWFPKGMSIEQAIIAVSYGHEIGVSPCQAIYNIQSINGRPTMWGDLLGALIKSSGLLEAEFAKWTEDPKQGLTCEFFIRRKNMIPFLPGPDGKPFWTHLGKFSVAMAKQAGLWGKPGPWTTYPQTMLKQRARTFAYRDGFPDVLRGLTSREEALDIPSEPNAHHMTVGNNWKPSPKAQPKEAVLERPVTLEAALSSEVSPPPSEAPLEASTAAPEVAEDDWPGSRVEEDIPPPPKPKARDKLIEDVMSVVAAIKAKDSTIQPYTRADLEEKNNEELESLLVTVKDFLRTLAK